jgi:hypothetical protein
LRLKIGNTNFQDDFIKKGIIKYKKFTTNHGEYFSTDFADFADLILLIISDFVGVLHCVFYSQYQRPERATSS